MKFHWRVLISLAIGVLVGLMITLLSPPGNFWLGWSTSAFLTSLLVLGLVSLWFHLGKNKSVAWMMILAFSLHLGSGMAVSLALPSAGYENDSQDNGYLFRDAYLRDQAAWDLAKSGQPIWTAFTQDFVADQYGGLTSISALIYRYLSPDVHRPFLILLLAAFVFTAAIPFLYDAISSRWGIKIALLACWIFTLYPEGLFYSVSQMREPFLIAGGAISFWAVLRMKREIKTSLMFFCVSILVTAMISWTVAGAILAVMVIWYILENATEVKQFTLKLPWWTYLVGAAILVAVIFVSIQWLSHSMSWDWVLAQRDSERAELEIARIGEWIRIPFTLVKGVAQVVLPAAIVQPSIAIWRGMTIFRSAGWYILGPLLVYGFYTILRSKPFPERRLMIWLAVFSLLWIFISSARAGGDLWDNPRYRTIFLPWFSLLAAFGLNWARENHDHWLGRFYIIEAICLLFFTEWYLARYYSDFFIRLSFWVMVAWIVGLSVLVIVGGAFLDYRKKKLKKTS